MGKDIAHLIKQASEAAKQAPEHLQEVAFAKAFDALVAAQNDGPAKAETKRQKPAARKGGANKSGDDRSLNDLDRTEHPDIRHSESALNNSLRLLRAAREDLAIDGLCGGDIARVLNDKFRCRITRQGVSLALNGAGRYVNRHKEGNLVIFRIMGPGESYLDELGAVPSRDKTVRPAKKNSRGSARQRKKAVPKTAQKKVNRSKASSGKIGSKAALAQLFEAGFFATPRAIGSITAELKHKYGRTFKSSEMSPGLLRYLRDGKLTREKNKDNQYEYQQS